MRLGSGQRSSCLEIVVRSKDFLDVKFVFESRVSNVDAHSLVNGALSLQHGR